MMGPPPESSGDGGDGCDGGRPLLELKGVIPAGVNGGICRRRNKNILINKSLPYVLNINNYILLVLSPGTQAEMPEAHSSQ